jgi:hypothetical protein
MENEASPIRRKYHVWIVWCCLVAMPGGIKAGKEIFVEDSTYVESRVSQLVVKRAAGASFSISVVCVISYPISLHQI